MLDNITIFTDRTDPFATLGTDTSEFHTAEDAMRAAGLDWTVEKYPLTTTVPVLTDEGVTNTVIPVPDKFALVRTNPSTQQPQVLSVMGNVYQPYQNLDMAEILNEITGQSGANFSTAGELSGGRRTFVSMKAPTGMMIGGQDAVDLFIVGANSFDGSSNITFAATPIRPVCRNTLELGLATAVRKIGIRHTSTAQERAKEAARVLGVMWNYSEQFESIGNSMIATPVSEARFESVVAGLFPEGKDETLRTKNSRERAVSTVRDLYYESPTQDGIRGTAWGAWNALTEYADWAWPVANNDPTKRAERTLTTGWVQEFKQKAYAALV